MKNRIVIAVLCVLLCCFTAVSVFTANAATYVTDSLWKLEIASDTEYYIEDYFGSEADLILPEKISDKNVVKINTKAFSDSPVVNLVVPSSYTSIDNYAFLNNKTLQSVSLPATLNHLGSNAFAKCTALKTVTFAEPSALDTFSASVFNGCTSIEEITLPYGVKILYGNVFVNCTGIKKVVVPVTVESMEPETFNKCPNVTLYVYDGSYALQYAVDYNIPYVNLGAYVEPTEPTTATEPVTTEEVITSSATVTDATEVTSSTVTDSSTTTDATESTTSTDFTEATVTTEPYESTPSTEVTSSTAVDESITATDATEPQSSSADVSSSATETTSAVTDSSSTTSESTSTSSAEESTSTSSADIFSTQASTEEHKSYFIGDADLDGRITIKDATIIQKHIAKLLALDDVALMLADTNNDTVVSVKDATQIQKFIAGFKDVLFVGDEVKL